MRDLAGVAGHWEGMEEPPYPDACGCGQTFDVPPGWTGGRDGWWSDAYLPHLYAAAADYLVAEGRLDAENAPLLVTAARTGSWAGHLDELLTTLADIRSTTPRRP